MKKHFFTIALGLVFCLQSFVGNAQTKINEGKIVYNMSWIDLPAEMQAMASMLPNSMTIVFNKNFSKITTGGGMSQQTTIIDTKKKKATTLISAMGQKFAVESDMDEDEDDSDVEVEIEYTDETAEIAGYQCKKAIVKTEMGNIEVYYTNELEINATTSTQGMFDQLEGFPVKYSVPTGNGLVMELELKKVEEMKPASDAFKIPDGYEYKTQEELQKMGGGF